MKIAIIEKKESMDLSRFDKVINFCMDDHPNVSDYLTLDDIFFIKKDINEAVCSWVSAYSGNEFCTYLDIEILQTYAVGIFGYIANVAQRALIINKIIEREKPTEIWIADAPSPLISRVPSLKAFLRPFVPLSITLNYFKSPHSEICREPKQPKNHKTDLLKMPFSILRNIGNSLTSWHDSNILIYSDLPQISMLFRYIRRKGVIFLREELPESLVLRIFRHGAQLRLLSDFKITEAESDVIEKAAGDAIDKLRDFNRPMLIRGLDFGPLAKEYLSVIWRKELSQTLKTAELANKLFSKFNIMSLLVDEDKSITKNILVQVARRHNCRSYVNCHGEPGQKIGYLPLAADKIFVWGRMQKKTLTDWRLEEDRVIVTGCTKFDNDKNVSEQYFKSKICKDLKLFSQKPLCLIAPVPLERGIDMLAKKAWENNRQAIIAASSFKELQVIIKLHPADESYWDLLHIADSIDSKRIKVLKDYDSLSLVRGADLLIVCTTTLAIDAIAYRKPVILMENVPLMDKYGYLNYFYDGSTTDSIKNSISDILNGSYKKHIENWATAVDQCLNGLDKNTSKYITELLQERFPKNELKKD